VCRRARQLHDVLFNVHDDTQSGWKRQAPKGAWNEDDDTQSGWKRQAPKGAWNEGSNKKYKVVLFSLAWLVVGICPFRWLPRPAGASPTPRGRRT
jgi:hypothetical protein